MREEAKQRTREALIEAGAELFGEEGLDTPSLDAICARAGYTRGAFYVHFRDRDELLEAVMDRVGTRFLDAVLGSSGDGAKDGEAVDLATVVARFVSAALAGDYPLMREGGVRPHQLLEACARSPAIRARYTKLVEESLRRIASGVRRGQEAPSAGAVRRDIDPSDAAVIVLAAVIGAQTLMELRVPVDVARGAAALLSLLSPAEEPLKDP